MASSLTNSHTPLNSNVMSDNNLLSIEEVEERIQQLLMENADLRNTLQQNNTYLRQMSITLVEWQEEVQHVQSEYREKFEKAKLLVTKLRQENAELKRHLNLPNNHVTTDPAPIPTSVAQIGIESTSPISMESYVVISSEMSPKASQEDDKLPSYDSLFQPKTRVEITDPLVCQLQREADALRAQLTVEMESNKTKQLLLNETQSQLDRLMVDYQELCRQWEEKKQIPGRGVGDNMELEMLKTSNTVLTKRCEESEEQMVSLRTRLAKAEELALAKQYQNSELQNRVALLESELETLPILRTQVELYQTDFEAERSARQNLAGEKDILAQQVRVLKRQMENLQSSRPSSAASGTGPISASVPEATLTQLECPKCRFSFTTMDSLNNHLDICLSQQMFP